MELKESSEPGFGAETVWSAVAGETAGEGAGAGNMASRWASCRNAEIPAAGGDAVGDGESGDAVETVDAQVAAKTAAAAVAGDAVMMQSQGAHGSGSSHTHWES